MLSAKSDMSFQDLASERPAPSGTLEPNKGTHLLVKRKMLLAKWRLEDGFSRHVVTGRCERGEDECPKELKARTCRGQR
jgi:hypothetical protein